MILGETFKKLLIIFRFCGHGIGLRQRLQETWLERLPSRSGRTELIGTKDPVRSSFEVTIKIPGLPSNKAYGLCKARNLL